MTPSVQRLIAPASLPELPEQAIQVPSGMPARRHERRRDDPALPPAHECPAVDTDALRGNTGRHKTVGS